MNRAIAIILCCVAAAASGQSRVVERIPAVSGALTERSALAWDDSGYATEYRSGGASASLSPRFTATPVEYSGSGSIKLRTSQRGGIGIAGVHTGSAEFSCSSTNPENVQVSLTFEKDTGDALGDDARVFWRTSGSFSARDAHALSGGTLTFTRAGYAVDFLSWFRNAYRSARIRANTYGMNRRNFHIVRSWLMHGSSPSNRDTRFRDSIELFEDAAYECVDQYRKALTRYAR